jgi:hypothetical protein
VRLAVLGSDAARRATGCEEERLHARKLLNDPLVAVLEEGQRDGTFPTVEPDHDAWIINAIVFGMVEWPAARGMTLMRAEAVEHVLRFCLPALGVGTRARRAGKR